ncbi:MAG TPA: CBS domain-containing protein, partial [Planctomycetota bacterium]|nr:CBS domain-containing protein [Planctomycetota bacterium]
VPVVDAEDKVVGILTDRDAFMNASHQGRALRELRAAGCMAGEVLLCRPGDSAVEVARKMGARKVRRVPVTDEGGRLVGLVSVGDILCAAASAPAKDQKALQAALVGALTTICARPSREEVAPVAPVKKRAGPVAKVAKIGKSNGKKRARV